MKLKTSNTNIKTLGPVVYLWFSFVLVYITIDFFRVFFDNSKYLLVINDFFILFIFLYLFVKRRNPFYCINYIPTNILFGLFVFVIIIFLQLFNLSEINSNNNIAGFRTYVLPTLGILVGFEFGLSNTLNQTKVYNFLLLVLYLVVGFSVFQIFIDTSKLGDIALSLVTSREHAVHSYEDESISLTSSFFASGKKFGRFLVLLFLIYSGVRVNLNKKKAIFIFILFLIGLVSSGSRESIYAFIFINVISFLRFSNIRSVFNFLFYSFLCFLFLIFFELNSDSITRLNFLLALGEDFGDRFIGLFPLSIINVSNDHIFFGIGLGKYGQEAILVQSISDLGERYLSLFFDNNYSNVISDSGIVKIIIETGLIGLFVFAFLICCMLYFAFMIFIKILNKSDRIIFNMCLYVLLWTFFFLKAHSIISDIFLTFHLFFAIGYLANFKNKNTFLENA